MALVDGAILELADNRAQVVAIADGNGDQTGTSGNPLAVTSMPVAAPATATLTSVASSIVSVTILALNAGRKKFIIVNNSTKNLYLAFAATASLTAFTLELGAQGVYASSLYDYTGIVTGIWNSANGFARVTEITA